MTESAAPIEHVRSDALPPITPAQAAALQEASAAAAAIHSARELGGMAHVSEAPPDPAAVATYCGLTPQGAAALFEAPRRRELPGPFPFTLITAIRR
jgi:hypothetical protein